MFVVLTALALTKNANVSWFAAIVPLLIGLTVGCVVCEPYKQKTDNSSAVVLLLVLTTAAGISLILDVYHISTGMALSLVAVATDIAAWFFLWLWNLQADELDATVLHDTIVSKLCAMRKT